MLDDGILSAVMISIMLSTRGNDVEKRFMAILPYDKVSLVEVGLWWPLRILVVSLERSS
jgi:hypothetical protein